MTFPIKKKDNGTGEDTKKGCKDDERYGSALQKQHYQGHKCKDAEIISSSGCAEIPPSCSWEGGTGKGCSVHALFMHSSFEQPAKAPDRAWVTFSLS